jgi:putative Mg2+ transporter-C (MgtC) family protein
VRADPLRILSAIITGVSFLGAGTIIRRRDADAVEGLTTAASLLVTAAIGAAVALTQTALALGATALVFATLRALARVEERLHRSR